jgi:hypothetical protein
VRVIKTKADRFNNPIDVAVKSSIVWVVNGVGSIITELSTSTGAFVRLMR